MVLVEVEAGFEKTNPVEWGAAIPHFVERDSERMFLVQGYFE